MKKLQNSFKTFLPQNYRAFKAEMPLLSSNAAVVASLLRICCEEEDIKAIKLAFERILGKPEKVVVIKRTLLRVVFPEATRKLDKPELDDQISEEIAMRDVTTGKVVVDADDAPGFLLNQELQKMDDRPNTYSYDVLDKKNDYTVVEVLVANLYAIAMRGTNLGAISMLFDYLDGAVADVVRLDGENTLVLENYADVAPYEAKQDENGVWYVERESVK